MKIYWPVTCDILTPGHIKCLRYLKKRGTVIVGLLTPRALRGYKKEVVPFKDRRFILRSLGATVVSQETLNPEKNIKKYKCQGIASGDGWEEGELKTIIKLRLTKINIKFRGEKKKLYSSSSIKKLCQKKYC